MSQYNDEEEVEIVLPTKKRAYESKHKDKKIEHATHAKDESKKKSNDKH